MAAKRVNKIAVVTGEYQKDGETKKSRETVGYEMEDEGGRRFIRLKRSFNPAGVPFREGDDTIILGIWPIDDANTTQPPQRGSQTRQEDPPQRTAGDDQIPF